MGPGSQAPPRKVLDDLDLALLGEIDGYDSTEMAKSKPPKESNIGKPVTRIRKELSIPRHHRISHQGFKFPSATPRPKRTPGWKLGSGFEGIELQRSTPSTVKQTYNAVIKRAKHSRFQTPNSRALELRTTLSPSGKAGKYTAVIKSELDMKASIPLISDSSFEETRELHPIPKVGALRTLECLHGERMRDAAQLSPPVDSQAAQDLQRSYKAGSQMLCPERNNNKYSNGKQSPDTRAIRKPSKSEQNGWLERRRKVGFATASGEYNKPLDPRIHPGAKDESTESILDQHNATWYHESSMPAGYSQTCQDAASHQPDDGDHHQTISIVAGSSEAQDMIPDSGGLSQTSRLPYPSRERSRNLEDSPATSTNKVTSYIPLQRYPVAPSQESVKVQDSQEQSIPECPIPTMEAAISPQGMNISAGLVDTNLFSAADQILELEDTDQSAPLSSTSGPRRSHEVSQPSFNVSRYFTNAVQQSNLPLQRSVATPIRKPTRHSQDFSSPNVRHRNVPRVAFSTQQGSHGVNVLVSRSLGRTRTEGGNLELGMTRRLQRSMSNLQFRPPFKALV